jgi:hypothetical protein
MDRAKAAFFAARQEIAGALSKPETADKAVTELIRLLNIDPTNSPSSSSNDTTTLKALALIWGSTAGHDDTDISSNIDACRRRYVAAIGGNAEKRAASATDFDEKVKTSLSESLGPRNRSIYANGLSQQKQRWVDGNVTTSQMAGKMVALARQLDADTENIFHGADGDERLHYFMNEVKGTLAFIDNEKDLMQALYYLWGAVPEKLEKDQFRQFDDVMNDVVSMMVDAEEKNGSVSSTSGFDRDHAIQLKKREFIREARSYLGSLLPDRSKVAIYVDAEASARKQHMEGGRSDYDGYKQQMLRHLASMQAAVLKSPAKSEKARLASAVDEAVEKLFDDSKGNHSRWAVLSITDALVASYSDVAAHESAARWKEFENCRDQFVDIASEKNEDRNASENAFTRAVQKVLIGMLPDETVKQTFKELLVELDSLLEKKFITHGVYNDSALKLLKKASGEALADENPGSKETLQFQAEVSHAKSVGEDPIGTRSLHEEVTEALELVLRQNSGTAKVLDCLQYFWGGSESRLHRSEYTEFGNRRNKYIQAHGGKAVSAISTDCEFVREARRILVGRLPEKLQEEYGVQQKALGQFGLSGTAIAESTKNYLYLSSRASQ